MHLTCFIKRTLLLELVLLAVVLGSAGTDGAQAGGLVQTLIQADAPSPQWVEATGILNKGMSTCGMPWLTDMDGVRTWWIRPSELLTDIPEGTGIALKGWLYSSGADACQTRPIIDATELCLLPATDINADGWVNIVDLQLVAAAWHAENFNPRLDVNGDGVIDIVDLALVAADFGLNQCQVGQAVP